jgi:ABC-type transport system involved in multi-copper enzyme maturation permease subunit
VSLYRAETRRLVKRRFTKFFVLGALVLLLAVAAGVFFSNQKVGPAQVASAQQRADRDFAQAQQQSELEQQRCQAAPGTSDAANYPADCTQLYTPNKSDYPASNYMPATFDFRKNFGDMVTTLAALLAVTAFVVGASFVGAEWNSGGMMNLLLWRPQRLRVLGTKLVSFLAVLTALTVVASVIWTGIFALVAQQRGSLASMTSGAWQSFALMEVRALALVLVVGAVGFGLASLGRHTAMALGVAIGVVIVFQFGLGVVLERANVKFTEAFLIPVWVYAWVNKSVKLENYDACNFSANGGCRPDTLTITWPMAGALFGTVVVLVVGLAMWTMRSRDIT